MFRFMCFVSVILGVKSALAPFITPCGKGDQSCLKESAVAAIPYFISGVPELGITPLDPMRLPVVRGDQAGLQLTFKDTVVKGLKNCVIEDIKLDTEKSKLSITTRCTVTLQGNYKVGGKLLILPVQGEGKFSFKIRDIIIKAYTILEPYQGDDGKSHWNIGKWGHTYRVQTGAQFKLDNLFNGNKILGDPVNAFLNSNWQEVMQEVAAPIVHSLVAAVVEDVGALYKAVPLDELTLR